MVPSGRLQRVKEKSVILFSALMLSTTSLKPIALLKFCLYNKEVWSTRSQVGGFGRSESARN
ncbi:hypothetical protein BJX76DRAFT_344376 [Aspergillus varians]